GEGAGTTPGMSTARRADKPPGRAVTRLARGRAERLPRDSLGGYARRRVSRPRRHANPRTARAVCRELRRQLQRVPATEGGAPSAAGPRGSSPGARDRAPGAVHRALSREEQQGDARQEPREGAGED